MKLKMVFARYNFRNLSQYSIFVSAFSSSQNVFYAIASAVSNCTVDVTIADEKKIA